ncbi:MAG: hypothetical protein WCD13_19600 [Pseudolabrys sp.]
MTGSELFALAATGVAALLLVTLAAVATGDRHAPFLQKDPSPGSDHL